MVARALVVGNATVDETYAVPSLPGPGESVLGQFRLRDVGGKGANVATLLARCRIPTQLTAAIGDDERGIFVRDSLSNELLKPDLQVSSAQATDISIVYADTGGGNMIVTTTAAACSLECSRVKAAINSLNPGDMLIMQGNLTEALTFCAARLAGQLGLVFILNPSPYAPWMKALVSLADVIFVNAEEGKALTGLADEAAVLALLECGPRQVVLSCGERGVLMAEKNAPGVNTPVVSSIAAFAGPVIDTTGAGDTLLAVAIASARLRDVALDTIALNHAVRAAAITIGAHGTHQAFPTAGQLSTLLSG